MDAVIDDASLPFENDFRRMMDADEREVYLYLKGQPDQSFPATSICRYAGGKHKFRESPDWARPVLLRMLERGIVEIDTSGAYRLKPLPKDQPVTKRWVSPQIAAILSKSGRNFDGIIKGNNDSDTYYNSL